MSPLLPRRSLLDMETYRGYGVPSAPHMSPYRSGNPLPVEALQGALAAEHAAMWVYGVAGAFVPNDMASRLDEAATEHQGRRDATERMLISAGVPPVPAEPGYLTPEPV
ncbi:MAG: hypothetical protein QOG46_1689, partial [Pseudonocardiales bacterium]|nr:hypothetical protein [Pseudonocardiales bacterium]